MEQLKFLSLISFNSQKDTDLYSGNQYCLTQIGSSNSDKFIEFYLSNYKKVHSSAGEYSATDEMIKNVYLDNELHKDTSIYLVLKKEGNLFATLKGTKRGSKEFRIETEFGFDILKFLKKKSFDNLSIWHHSKTSLDKSQLLPEEKLKIRDYLKTLYYALYIKLYDDNCQVLLGEVNDLNYKSMDANNIKMKIVTEPKKTIGMPAYGITISRSSIKHFLNSENFADLFKRTLL